MCAAGPAVAPWTLGAISACTLDPGLMIEVALGDSVGAERVGAELGPPVTAILAGCELSAALIGAAGAVPCVVTGTGEPVATGEAA